MSLLSDFRWKTKYDSDEHALVRDFYNPALSSATRYDRTTGFFSARVLTLAARGIEGLVRNQGRMRLIVGCTLQPPEVQAIERGEDLRDTVSLHLQSMPLAPGGNDETAALELLSWMIARGYLEVKVAVPCTPDRRPYPAQGLFHEKAGVIEDKTGDRLAFNGSVNETAAGWATNWESFHVFTSWSGEGGLAHVEEEERSFQRLWNDRARHCLVVDIPSAVRDDLLRFLPEQDGRPQRLAELDEPERDPVDEPSLPVVEPPTATDPRALVWGVIRHAPALPGGGELVGEATSIVKPWPHQVRAFDRMYNAWPSRLLIADEVGLGKTIEAGLVLRQAWLAGRLKRCLILAPRAVVRQWQSELREKFNLNWPIYDGQLLRWYPTRALSATERRVSRTEWHQEPFVIASSHLMRRRDRAEELLGSEAHWDVIVLDEAHHARRKGAGLTHDRKPNQLLNLMQQLKDRAEGLLLLTATPMQVHPVEVWDLLNLLGLPDLWDERSFLRFFDKIAHPNPSNEDFEFLASMFRAAEQRYGLVDEAFARRYLPNEGTLAPRQVLRALRDGAETSRRRLETARRRAAIRLMTAASPVGRLISRHTRELLRKYYQAGRISTPVPTRVVDDVFVDLSPAERVVYDAVEDYISTTYNNAQPDRKNAVGFVMTVYRRRLASSFHALRETLGDRLRDLREPGRVGINLEDLPDDDALDESIDEQDASFLSHDALEAEERGDIENLVQDAERLPRDTKAERLIVELRRLRDLGHQQALVFTQFTDTVDFLRDALVSEGFSVLCFTGRGGERIGADRRWHVVSRETVKRAFRDGAADILLCSDAAAEGLNFQFCGALVNYDLPWNPMKVEQRIGRIDRLGQRFPEIRIVNLHYNATVEADVYKALRGRIGLFERFVGKLQPILSALPRRIADVALAPADVREREKEAIVSRVQQDVSAAEASPFDLDQITEDEVSDPVRPAPLYDLAALDMVLGRADLLPPGIEARSFQNGEYVYSKPGLGEPLRVTTSAAYFEEQPESVELWSPGSPLFPDYDAAADAESVAAVGGRLESFITGLKVRSEGVA